MAFLSEIFGYILNFFYELINNYGIAIIVFSILLRLILIPITIKQQKTSLKPGRLILYIVRKAINAWVTYIRITMPFSFCFVSCLLVFDCALQYQRKSIV